MLALLEPLAGALSPLIIVLATMMMTGSSGGSSSYSFSGKTDDVGFLLLKARAAARKIPCPHRRALSIANAALGGTPLSYAEFFDLSAKPGDIASSVLAKMAPMPSLVQGLLFQPKTSGWLSTEAHPSSGHAMIGQEAGL